MKTLLLLIAITLYSKTLLAQSVLTNPNKYVKGKKQGLWSEFNFLDTIDFNGKYHIVYGQHHVPKSVIAEGAYINNERQGFWKTYWIIENDAPRRFKKGNIKSIIEYRNNVPCGLIVEYYPNGNIKAIGQYDTFPVNESYRIQVPDWRNPEKGKLKDSVIYNTLSYKPKDVWKYFLENGSLY